MKYENKKPQDWHENQICLTFFYCRQNTDNTETKTRKDPYPLKFMWLSSDTYETLQYCIFFILVSRKSKNIQ